MFVGKVAKPQSKPADSPSVNLARQQSIDAARPFNLWGTEVGSDSNLETYTETTQVQQVPRAIAWDFSKIPIFPSNPPHGCEAKSSPAPSPSLMVPQSMRELEPRAASRLPRGLGSALVSAPPIIQSALQSPGASLDAASRRFYESHFDHDFSKVQIHTGVAAARSAEAIQARAFTFGEHIVFGAGEEPEAKGSRRLLAHELAHVVQQEHGSAPDARRDASESLEAEADCAASAIDHAGGRVLIRRSGPRGVARQAAPPPQVAKLLSPADIVKLQAFGQSDYQESLNALQEILKKTKGFTEAGSPHQYVDIRQAAGELRAFLDYIRNPAIAGVKVVPSQMGSRTPDLYLREVSGREFRGEIVNVTQASKDIRPDLGVDKQGRVVPRIPKAEALPGNKPTVELPTNEFKLGQIKNAISAKISPKTASGTTQLDAQNPATQAGGRPMATGGDVVVEVLEGSASKAELDKIITDLLPKLKPSSAGRVLISIVDSADPSAGRKVFEYVRGVGDVFVGSARTAFYRPGAAGGAAAGSASGGSIVSPQGETIEPLGEAPIEAPPGAKPGDPVKPVEALKTGEGAAPAGAAEAVAGKPKLRVGSGPKGRLIVNLGIMVGVAVLDMLNRAQMAKAESERALKWIEQTAAGSATSAEIGDLVEQQRMSIGRRQLNGQTVYATLSMKLAFTNDVIDSAVLRNITITDSDESSFTSSVSSHEPLFGVEGKVWSVYVSLPLDQVELSDVEKARLSLEKHDTEAAASPIIDPERLSALGDEHQRLLARLEEAKVKEAAAKREALGRSAVIADATKRSQQQAEIIDELRQGAANRPPSAQPQSPPTSGLSLLPRAAPADGPELLPGAPKGADPIALAAKTVAQSKAWAEKLEAGGTALCDRLGSNNRPGQKEIEAFLTEEHNWRLMTKWWMNHYRDESRPEAVNGLGELLDREVPKLQQLRGQLGGD